MLFGEVGKVYALFLHELSASMNGQQRAAERLLQQHKVAETIKKSYLEKKIGRVANFADCCAQLLKEVNCLSIDRSQKPNGF